MSVLPGLTDPDFEVRVVSDAGSFCWRRPMFIGSASAQKSFTPSQVSTMYRGNLVSPVAAV